MSMHVNEALHAMTREAIAAYEADHPASVRGLLNAQAFRASVEAAAVERALNDAELAAIIREGRQVERDTYFWSEVARIVGELVPQILTKFV